MAHEWCTEAVSNANICTEAVSNVKQGITYQYTYHYYLYTYHDYH